MNEPEQPRVVAIAVRTVKNGPMREVVSAEAVEDGGLVGDLPVTEDRGITLIDRRQWQETIDELGADLPWHTRRANVLCEGLEMASLIGKTVHLGAIELEIVEETQPCQLMDQLHLGLREALKPDCRGGVHGRVVKGGTFSVGDSITVE